MNPKPETRPNARKSAPGKKLALRAAASRSKPEALAPRHSVNHSPLLAKSRAEAVTLRDPCGGRNLNHNEVLIRA